MKFTTIHLDDNKIEISNSLLGKEVIKVNNQIVSSKYSLSGTSHHFNIIENGIEAPCIIITGMGLNGVVIDLYKNGKPILESPKDGCAFMVIAAFIIGFIISVIAKLFL